MTDATECGPGKHLRLRFAVAGEGGHMEETAKVWSIGREAQDERVLKNHQRAVAG